MISSLRGTVLHAGLDTVAIEVSGVGFSVSVPPDVARTSRVGHELFLHTHLIVREDAMSLVGFASADELDVFGVLLGVLATFSGIAAAWGLSRWQSRWCDVVDSILTLPMVLPPTVIGYYLLVLLGRRGWVGEWLRSYGIELVFTWQGAVVADTVVAFPMVL